MICWEISLIFKNRQSFLNDLLNYRIIGNGFRNLKVQTNNANKSFANWRPGLTAFPVFWKHLHFKTDYLHLVWINGLSLNENDLPGRDYGHRFWLRYWLIRPGAPCYMSPKRSKHFHFICAFTFFKGISCLNCAGIMAFQTRNWAASSEFVSSSIPSWQILTAHAQSFRGARDLAFCLDSLLVWASSGGSGETARMRRLAWTFAARIGDKYQICLTRSN